MKSWTTGTRVLAALLAVAVAVAGYFFYEWQSLARDPGQVSREQTEAVVAKVGRLIELPADEVPTIATVTDLSEIKDQPFFRRASVGDKVLVYPKAGKAYLYNPAADRLIEVAPLNLNAAPGAGAE